MRPSDNEPDELPSALLRYVLCELVSCHSEEQQDTNHTIFGGSPYGLAAHAGFEPTHTAVKVLCLTA